MCKRSKSQSEIPETENKWQDKEIDLTRIKTVQGNRKHVMDVTRYKKKDP